jgi:hypothetical protein
MDIRSLPAMVSIDKKDRKAYEELKEDPFFGACDNKDVFFMCAGFGFYHKKRKKIEANDGFFRASYLNDKELGLMNAINFTAYTPEEVSNLGSKIFQLIEEYAHAGLYLLKDYINSKQWGSTDIEMEKFLVQVYDTVK